MVRHILIWALEHLLSVWCKFEASWSWWSRCIILIQKVELEQLLSGVEGSMKWYNTLFAMVEVHGSQRSA